ncbi:SMI1/KNR4 family protein [Halomonas qinghailakensis]|uniref:SMI1/KNR4 family protein n=1 Tax=Halomonas qinghailakensis TaxID=2937790 RepID=A0AA46YQN0_9GAMM|nr:SMI1/KNR4 family protein [Halomonas sp. ZZQ-149]UYO74645.1 SMI1/KNR4 family protein [Halomonas sp. ZZQ-149]
MLVVFLIITAFLFYYPIQMKKLFKQEQKDFENGNYTMSILSSQELWDALAQELKIIAPKITIEMNTGASPQDFQKLEYLIGATLPDGFKRLYVLHNGQKNCFPPFYYTEELLSIDRIIQEWSVWKQLLDNKYFQHPDGTSYTSEPHPHIKNNWWNPKWIPITNDGNGNHLCLDLDPADGGLYGQIIRMWHDDSARSVEAFSLEDLFNQYLKKLKSGDFFYSDDYGGIIEKWEERK